MYRLRGLAVQIRILFLAMCLPLMGCPDEGKDPFQVERPAGGFQFVEPDLRVCVEDSFAAQLEVHDQALGPINDRRRDEAEDGVPVVDLTTSDIFTANPFWAVFGRSVGGGAPGAGPQPSTGPFGEPGQTESRQYECHSEGMSEIWAYAPGGLRYVASAKMNVNCVDCTPPGGGTGGSDPVDDCKEDSVGFKACPASIRHVDVLSVNAVRDAAGATITATTLAPIPQAPVGRVDLNLVLEDAAGNFLDALDMRSPGGAPFLPPTTSGVTLGEDDGVVISDAGDAVFSISQDLLDMLPGEVGRYYFEIGDDYAEGDHSFFDTTETFAFPVIPF